MATSTFYDNIILTNEGAERLITVLNAPPPIRKESNNINRKVSEEQLKQIRLNLKKLSQA
jgi:hypothetical protein